MRSTGTLDDRYLTILAHRNPLMPASVLRNEFQHAIRIRLCDSLHEVRLYFMRPLVVPRITNPHRRARLTWAHEHLRWNNQWPQMLFTDEHRFSVDHPDNRADSTETCYDLQFVVPRNWWGRGSVMVWGGISAPQRIEFHVVQGNINAINDRDTIREPIVVTMAARM